MENEFDSIGSEQLTNAEVHELISRLTDSRITPPDVPTLGGVAEALDEPVLTVAEILAEIRGVDSDVFLSRLAELTENDIDHELRITKLEQITGAEPQVKPAYQVPQAPESNRQTFVGPYRARQFDEMADKRNTERFILFGVLAMVSIIIFLIFVGEAESRTSRSNRPMSSSNCYVNGQPVDCETFNGWSQSR